MSGPRAPSVGVGGMSRAWARETSAQGPCWCEHGLGVLVRAWKMECSVGVWTQASGQRSGASRPVHTDSMKHKASGSDMTSQATGLPSSNPAG